MAHTCNSTLVRARREDLELKVGLGYIEVIPYLKKKKKYLNAFDLFIYFFLFYLLFVLRHGLMLPSLACLKACRAEYTFKFLILLPVPPSVCATVSDSDARFISKFLMLTIVGFLFCSRT